MNNAYGMNLIWSSDSNLGERNKITSAKIESYFKRIDTILEGTNHQLLASGRKTHLVNHHSFNSKIKLYNSTSELLNDL